tara:strand:+ start:172 stop:723 length:552 start_codon:yes stop_codon:yes gene_type:complete
LTKNLITINQFIEKSLGEWKSTRSTHSLAFQEVESSTSKILIKEIEKKNNNVITLLNKFNFSLNTPFLSISISWQAISDWEENKKFAADQTILLFLPTNKNSGIVLRNKGYAEKIFLSAEYFIDHEENLNLKTFYNSTVSEERICFLSTNVRSRYSVIRNKENNSVMQTSHASEIRNITTLKD